MRISNLENRKILINGGKGKSLEGDDHSLFRRNIPAFPWDLRKAKN
jgi:hypothetical protein